MRSWVEVSEAEILPASPTLCLAFIYTALCLADTFLALCLALIFPALCLAFGGVRTWVEVSEAKILPARY